MLSKIFLASTTSNSIQSSWEDLGQFEEFDNIDEEEMRQVKRESKNPLRKISLSQKLITEIRTIYTEYDNLFNEELSNENDDDFNQSFLKREEKLQHLLLEADKNLNRLLNILNFDINISSIDQNEKKELSQKLENNQPSIEKSTLFNIVISAEQIHNSILNRYKKEAAQAYSSKSSLSASPNTNKNNLTCEKKDNTYKARVTTYLTSLESTPQENNFSESSKNNPLILESQNNASFPNLPLARNKTAIFRNFQKTSPCLNSRCLSCESIDEKMAIIIQNNDQKDQSNNNDDSCDDSDDLLELNRA